MRARAEGKYDGTGLIVVLFFVCYTAHYPQLRVVRCPPYILKALIA